MRFISLFSIAFKSRPIHLSLMQNYFQGEKKIAGREGMKLNSNIQDDLVGN